jgi:23S rRNA pseudouridine2605 synthase
MAENLQRKIGLARALSKLGYCSRSRAAELIRAGRVKLNGAARRDPETPVRLGHDRIEVAGVAVDAQPRIYLVMNKPRGIVTTAADEKGRDTVYSLLPPEMKWIAPVGRLDKASEGLLLLTNDSEWGARIAAPETHLPKKYDVQVRGVPDAVICEGLTKGVRAADGEMLRAASAKLLRSGEKNSWLQIVLEEGKNRQIRRMLDALGIETLRLVRVAIGPLELGTLAKGCWRELGAAEKRALDLAMAATKTRAAARAIR